MTSPETDARTRPLERLRTFLRKHGVPVGPVVVAEGRLRIQIDIGRDRPLTVHVGPRSDRAPYRTVGGLALGYTGVRQLDDLQQTWLDLVTALLARSGDRLPLLLRRSGAVGVDELPVAVAVPLEFPFCTMEVVDDTDGSGPRMEVLVRMTIRCNQACPFCSAPPPLPDPPADEVRRLLDRVSASGLRGLVTLTGGEPTIRKDLPDIVGHALRGPANQHVHVQTNAVFFHRPERVELYPKDARLGFFVSLHAIDEAIYDACTATKGQLPRAIEGVRNLLDAGHELLLNCVVNRWNVDHLREWIEAIPRLFPGSDPLLHFSVTMCPEHRPDAPDLLVPYTELAPKLEAAVRRADELGLRHDPLQSSTHASIPACLVTEAARQDHTHRPRIGEHETGYEDLEKLWVKAARCRTCSVNPWCLGLPRPYARKFGLEELTPI